LITNETQPPVVRFFVGAASAAIFRFPRRHSRLKPLLQDLAELHC
jgi:hypothetical protein